MLPEHFLEDALCVWAGYLIGMFTAWWICKKK